MILRMTNKIVAHEGVQLMWDSPVSSKRKWDLEHRDWNYWDVDT